jgi:predicted ArsR family transcriptional regulator
MQQPLTGDLLEILRVMKSKGGTHCTGTCHHRQPGEFHCHEFGRMLSISSQGVKNRLLALMQMGLVEPQYIERPTGGAVVRMTITAQAEELLAHQDRAQPVP